MLPIKVAFFINKNIDTRTSVRYNIDIATVGTCKLSKEDIRSVSLTFPFGWSTIKGGVLHEI